MFLFLMNEETGKTEIYCTECNRFIDNICVNDCPVYKEEEVSEDDQQRKI